MMFSELQFPSMAHVLVFSAITLFLLNVGASGFVDFSFVVVRYYCFDVTHAAVA